MLPRDYLVSEPIAINIQNRQHIRSFYPFNSVREAFSKSLRQVICALCFRTEPDSCHPNSHFSFQSLRFFLRFLSRPFFIILTHLIRSETPASPPRPIPSSEPNLITKFTDELKQNQTTTQSTKYKKKNTLYPCFTERMKFNSFLVEYHSELIRRIKGLIENGRVTLRKVQVES